MQVGAHHQSDGHARELCRPEAHKVVALVECDVARVGRLEVVAAIVLLRLELLERATEARTFALHVQ